MDTDTPNSVLSLWFTAAVDVKNQSGIQTESIKLCNLHIYLYVYVYYTTCEVSSANMGF